MHQHVAQAIQVDAVRQIAIDPEAGAHAAVDEDQAVAVEIGGKIWRQIADGDEVQIPATIDDATGLDEIAERLATIGYGR